MIRSFAYYLFPVDADEVALAEQPLHKTFELRFTCITVTYKDSAFFIRQPLMLEMQTPINSSSSCSTALSPFVSVRIYASNTGVGSGLPVQSHGI